MGALNYTLTVEDDGSDALLRWDARLELLAADGDTTTLSGGLGATPLAAIRAALDDVENYDDDAARVLRYSIGADERMRFYDGFPDAPVCPCGNDVARDGFITVDAEGLFVSPNVETLARWTHILCPSCGRYATEVPDDAPDMEKPDADELVTIPGAGIVTGRLSADRLADVRAASEADR
ncbi:hypothetical protein ACFCZ3_20145 [Cellulosimicrobium cellulans]|uniref:hypothetical protein n=1 Tax=Cellulosimicrobium cellulans TaxID=1710 RepID=UPI0035DEECA9